MLRFLSVLHREGLYSPPILLFPQLHFFPLRREYRRESNHPLRVFYEAGIMRGGRLSYGHLQAVAVKRTSLLILQQSVVSEIDRVHAGRGRDEAVEMVRRLS